MPLQGEQIRVIGGREMESRVGVNGQAQRVLIGPKNRETDPTRRHGDLILKQLTLFTGL
jgi:hypothetical protein